ncbi:aspergillopepsin A-like aspartic endopeptidase [Physcia stellaris]|nr:aspergillopepsin A-like aspartic endopeptidase [Physcia stellaris]
MAPLTTILLLALTILSATAAPAPLSARSFTINRRHTGRYRTRNGPAEFARAYRKYGWSVPPGLQNSTLSATNRATAPDNQEGSTQATAGEADSEFLSPVQIGGQTLMLDFDTGSADLWVFNTQLPAAQTKGHAVYDPSKSKTFKRMEGSTFNISYGDKSGALGTVGTDTVSIGGAVVASQAIELATSVTQSFIDDVDSDGLLGLGFMSSNTISPKQQDTFFGNVARSLKAPLFTANLKHRTAGSYQFGAVDRTQFVGTMKLTPVDKSQGYWQFPSKLFQVGDAHPVANPFATPAIADTGTSLLLVDDVLLKAYYSAVEGASSSDEGFTFPCTSHLPDLKMQLGREFMATIPGELINYQAVGGGRCYGGLQSSQGQPIQILGDILFKAVFVVFDARGPAIGFAPHA